MALNEVQAERDSDKDLAAAIQELQRLKFSVVDGAAADTDIAIAGIALDDTLVSVIEVAADTGVPTDRTAEAAITSAGNIQLADTSTAGDRLLVVWFDKAA